MKKILIGLISLLICVMCCGCRTVVVTSADELVSRHWQAETLSGVCGELVFTGNTAELTIISATGDEVSLSGALAVDSSNFYITSSDYYRTYIFSYKVYKDRAEITYGEDTLVFYPVEPSTVTDG